MNRSSWSTLGELRFSLIEAPLRWGDFGLSDSAIRFSIILAPFYLDFGKKVEEGRGRHLTGLNSQYNNVDVFFFAETH